jgi:hypothetical protein
MVKKLTTAIALRSANNVLMRNVTISGFNKGIEALDSNLLLSGVNVQRCGVGLDLISSNAAIYRSQLIDNAIDIVVNQSRAFLINTLAYRILRILPRGDYRINPYHIELIAHEIINTADISEKRKRLRTLLNILKKTPYAWTIYQIIKEIIGFV